MSEFTIRSESVDVEQIMKQIRQRILEKRGADYTEDEIRELASVRLEKFLDPNNLRSDLLEQFRKSRPATTTEPPVITPPFTEQQTDIFATHRGGLRFIRKLLAPLLKLMFNANTLHQVLHTQAQFNVDLLKREARRKIEFDRSRAEWNSLYYEVLHNLVLETTRMGIEVQNLRMKSESLSSRLDFSERRVRALEGVVQYRPEVVRASERHDHADEDHAPAAQASTGGLEGFVPAGTQPQPAGDGAGRKRRRRRRGRRGGQGAEGALGASGAQGAQPGFGQPGQTGNDDNGFDDAGDDDNGDEQDASASFDVPEPIERPDELDTFARLGTFDAPRPAEAPEASASAREKSGEFRRDLDEAASGREVGPQAPQASAFAPEESSEPRRDKPGSSEDDQQ
jgi:hypothetical protein